MCSLVIVSAAVYADLKKGYYLPAELGSVPQAVAVELSPDSNYQVSAYPMAGTDLAPGDGVQEVRIYCNTCHSLSYITMQPPLPAATWEAEVNKMNKAFGAGIPADSTQKIILYLQAHYTGENRNLRVHSPYRGNRLSLRAY
jgi:hypothetical protein